MNLADLANLRFAEASGHVELFNDGIFCPPTFYCETCSLYVSCHANDGVDLKLLQLLPEYSLTLDELRALHPELFI